MGIKNMAPNLFQQLRILAVRLGHLSQRLGQLAHRPGQLAHVRVSAGRAQRFMTTGVTFGFGTLSLLWLGAPALADSHSPKAQTERHSPKAQIESPVPKARAES